MYRINNIDELTPQMIQAIIKKFKQEELPRMQKLKDYYLNDTAILNRVQEDPSKPNNKVVHPYAQYITDTLTAYFMGEPVSYSSQEDITPLNLVLEYNDEQDENMELAKNTSIYGKAWEMLYIDSAGSVKFKVVDTREVIPIYDKTIEDNLIAVIRFYNNTDILTDKENTIIEVYTKDLISYFKAGRSLDNIVSTDAPVSLYFGDVPFVEFKNNKDCLGDYEGVISLIDAYDSLVSDNLNDYDYFVDAYLALYGYTADSEDVTKMKQDRVLLMDADTKAEFLTKDTDNSSIEGGMTRIEKDIHKFAKCPDSSDENFCGNVSGVAMKYKLLGTENIGSTKESKFKKGLQKRIKLILTGLSLLRGESIDALGIKIIFVRNLPVNVEDLASTISKLNGIVSKRTLIGQLPFVEDADKELEQLQSELGSSVYYSTAYINKNDTIEE